MSNNHEFASANLTAGQLNAIVKKLGGSEAALKFLRGELTAVELPRSWREEKGVIYFSVTSDGTNGPAWISRLSRVGFHVDECAKSILCSEEFVPTNGVTTEVAVLKGLIFIYGTRHIGNIRAYGYEKKFNKLNVETACLIREKFSDDELEIMGLTHLVVMHEPIKGRNKNPRLLYVANFGMAACDASSDEEWKDKSGFAFAAA